MGKETDKRWKGIVIDWDEISQMDSADYELKPLNQQQVAILLALLQYQKWRTRWLNLDISNDELLAYIADIEYRLMMNEDAGMVTKQELIDGICEGMQCYTENIAKRIISGVTSGIVIDENGDVVVGGATEDGTLPEDDPGTPYSETKGGKYGAAVSVAKGIEGLLDVLDVLYGNTNGTPLTALADAQTRVKMLYPTDASQMDTAIATYYTWRGTNNRILFDTTAVFPQTLYCKGVNEFGVQRFMAESSGYVGDKLQIISDLITGLSQQFFDEYYAAGAIVPSTAYLEAPCEPSPPETLLLTTIGVAYNTQTTWKARHRLKIKVSGYFVDSAAQQNTRDFWWNITPAGVLTFQNGGAWQQGSSAPTKPTSNQVPYRTDHTYTFTADTNSSGFFQLSVPTAGLTAPYSSPTGGVTVFIEDLGEYLG